MPMNLKSPRFVLVALLAAMCPLPVASAADGLRVVAWNISNYSGGRTTQLQTAVYGQFEGRSMDPDVFVVQEVLSQFAANSLLDILNTAPNSPGDWAAAPFINGPDTDNAMFYRTSKVEFLGQTVLPADGVSGSPRDVNRYDVRLIGYGDTDTRLSFYSVHMKAGSGSTDQSRRLIEAQKIRADAETLDPAVHIMVLGDFNIQRSTQSAYVFLTGSQQNNDGRVVDPIGTPGSWNNNPLFTYVHTQDPSGAGGMDDRHDQILVDPALGDGSGLEYRGVFGLPYSTTTWNDPNHSYRSWGNDGSSFNVSMTINGNEMVGASIASALVQIASGGGHLPVFLDLIVPAQLQTQLVVKAGDIVGGTTAEIPFNVENGGDVARWGAGGIADLEYSIEANPPLIAPPGTFVDAAGGGGGLATIGIDTTGLPFGPFEYTFDIVSNDPDMPVFTQTVLGAVVPDGCSADLAEPFGELNFFDVAAFIGLYNAGDPAADLAEPFGSLNFFDISAYIAAFNAGCP
ncbi:MAG: GC-type dockerin domain-anchored protein [Planctomycetota bacterium]